MGIILVPMTMDHYEAVTALWRAAEGLWQSDDNEYDNMARFLARNPGLSQVSLEDGKVVGAVKCGHDGRRGYLHHLAVLPEYQHRGIGRALVAACLARLREEGITKVRCFVRDDNANALAFWRRVGFMEQAYDYRTMEFSTDS